MGINGTKLRNETPFFFLAAIVATGDGWDCTNFHIRIRMISAIELSGNGPHQLLVTTIKLNNATQTNFIKSQNRHAIAIPLNWKHE